MSHREPLTPAKPQALAGWTLLSLWLACAVVAAADRMLCKGETEAHGSESALNTEANVCLSSPLLRFPMETSMSGHNREPGDLPQAMPAAGTTGEAGCKGMKIQGCC